MATQVANNKPNGISNRMSRKMPPNKNHTVEDDEDDDDDDDGEDGDDR